jgi:hypothetical protein
MANVRSDVDTVLAEAAAARAKLRAVEAELQQVTGELRRVRSDELRWQQQAAEAADELRRLTGFGPFVLMRRWLGDAAEHAEVATARIAEARHEQEVIDTAAGPLLQRQQELESLGRSFAGVDERYAAAAQAKVAALVRAGGDLATRAQQSAARLDELAGELRTFDGIIESARDAEMRLVTARDTMAELGIGRVATAGHAHGAQFRRQRLWDRTVPEIERANGALDAFAAKLATSADGRAAADALEQDRPRVVAIDDAAGRSLSSQTFAAVRDEVVDRLERLRRSLLLLERRRGEMAAVLASAVHAREAWLEGV